MSGFTLTSGRRTMTHASYCPGCLRRREVTHAERQTCVEGFLPAHLLYCGAACQARDQTRRVAFVERWYRHLTAGERAGLGARSPSFVVARAMYEYLDTPAQEVS